MAKFAKRECFTCKKGTRTFMCDGCSQHFCRIDLTKHLEQLSVELEQIENNHDQVRQNLNHQKENPNNYLLIEEINQWEKDSMEKIKHQANQCREKIIKYKIRSLISVENHLNELTNEIKTIRQENEYNESDLNQLRDKLNNLEEELNKPSNISIKQQSTTFLNKIFISIIPTKDTQWEKYGITVAGGNGQGNGLHQLDRCFGICIDDDQTLYIADHWNSRIVKWKSNSTTGQVVAGGHGKGSQTNQLIGPTDLLIDKQTNSLIIADAGNRRVMRWSLQTTTQHGEIMISDIGCYGLAMNKDGDLYISDCNKNEVRRYKKGEKNGTIIAGGNGQGDQLNQLNHPTFIFVDENDTLYVSDTTNHRVMKWMKDAKQGVVVAGGNGKGNSLSQLSNPRDVIVDQLGQIYVTDIGNHRVMRWCKDGKQGSIVIGGNAKEQESNQLSCPTGLSFDREGNLYVVDCWKRRIQKYEID